MLTRDAIAAAYDDALARYEDPTVSAPTQRSHTVVAMLREARRWGLRLDADPPQQSRVPSADRVREYLRGCARDGAPGHGRWLAETYGTAPGRWHWCAAAVGWAESSWPGRTAPSDAGAPPQPSWRSGVAEIQSDALRGRRPGRVVTPDTILRERSWPGPGALVIQPRAGSALHIEVLVTSRPDAYLAIGGNEVTSPGRWHLEWTSWSRATVLLDAGAPTLDELAYVGCQWGHLGLEVRS